MFILPIGGRIKAASVGLDHLLANGAGVDENITRLRREPTNEMRAAFFPRTGKDLAQAIRGVGFFRPTLKTDQGMPGNFLPFVIDANLERTDLGVRSIESEEGVVIPEAWHTDSNGLEREIQAAFLQFDLGRTFKILQQLEGRRAEKGRLPFMFIRPALPEHTIVFGQDVLRRAQDAVDVVLDRCIERAHEYEERATGKARPINMIYIQPDVYVLSDGTVVVEKLNCPDVGFFLAGLAAEGSRILPRVQVIMQDMLSVVADRIIEKMGPRITIVTRDAVLSQQEDVLEIREIEVLQCALTGCGAEIKVIPVSTANSVELGTHLLLLNLDYKVEESANLLRRYAADEVECFPNPYLQMACQEVTGMKERVIGATDKHRESFLQLASSQPSDDGGARDVLKRISALLERDGLTSDILHVALDTEVVPVLRPALHSWRQLVARVRRTANRNGAIHLRGIPACPDNLLLTSSTGPRLHAFRFMCVA